MAARGGQTWTVKRSIADLHDLPNGLVGFSFGDVFVGESGVFEGEADGFGSAWQAWPVDDAVELRAGSVLVSVLASDASV